MEFEPAGLPKKAAPARPPALDRVRTGARLRAVRRQQGLTLKDVSRRSRVALSTLSKMELGQASVSYEKLAAVAHALQIDIAKLFDPRPRSKAVAGPTAVRCTLPDAPRYDTANYELRMLATAFPDKRMTPAWGRIVARSSAEFDDFIRHPGQEFVMVLSGSVCIRFENGEQMLLKRHESAYFDSSVGHMYLARGRGEATVIVAMVPA